MIFERLATARPDDFIFGKAKGDQACAEVTRTSGQARMSGYILTADTDFYLDEIWEYIAADDIDAADRWASL